MPHCHSHHQMTASATPLDYSSDTASTADLMSLRPPSHSLCTTVLSTLAVLSCSSQPLVQLVVVVVVVVVMMSFSVIHTSLPRTGLIHKSPDSLPSSRLTIQLLLLLLQRPSTTTTTMCRQRQQLLHQLSAATRRLTHTLAH